MKKNINKIAILLLIFTAISCNNKDTVAPNVIKFWHFWSEPNQKQALAELIREFEKANNCTVEITELSWNDGKTKLMAAFNSGVAPDVLELGSDWIAQFSSNEILATVDDSINFNNFLDYSLPPAKWNNKFYAVPWVVDTRLVFYNKELMRNAGINDESPQDFNKLIEYSNKINSPEKNIYGFGTNGSDPHRLYKKILPIIWTVGGDIFDSVGNPIINSSKNAEALNIYLQLSRTGIIETQRQIDSYFAQGKIGFALSGAWLLEKIRNENPNLDFGVAMMPIYNRLNENANSGSEQCGISFLGCEYLAMSNKSNKKELGIKLIKFLVDGKNAIKLVQKFAEAGFPAEKGYLNSPIFKNDKQKIIFAEQLKYSKATPVHPRWLDIEEIIENAVSQALYGEKGANEALNLAQIEVLKLLCE